MSRRGIFEKVPGSGEWWIRYADITGRIRREKAGTWASARDLYIKRKADVLQGKKLPEKLRQRPAGFQEIAASALVYSKAHKARDSYRQDQWHMQVLLEWFGNRAACEIAPQEIERRLDELARQERQPATLNRYRSLISLTYRIAIRDGRVRDNPVRQVPRRRENNARVRFLDANEEAALRAKIRELAPEREPEFVLSLHTGMRRNEQYRLRWEGVNFDVGIITIRHSKNGESRHVPVNSEARRALAHLSTLGNGSGYVVPGTAAERKRDSQRWFEGAVKQAGIIDFCWHDLRHTFASRLAMAGVPLRTIAELLGHKTLAMTMRYAHLAPAHLRDAVECLTQPDPAGPRTRTDPQSVYRAIVGFVN
jgi:site-specific recombinase XerD